MVSSIQLATMGFLLPQKEKSLKYSDTRVKRGLHQLVKA